MNELIKNCESIYASIQSDFTSLWRCESIGDTVEIVTPYTSLSGEALTVFLTQRDDRFVVSDGAHIQKVSNEQSVSLESRKGFHLADMLVKFGVKEAFDEATRRVFRFKSTKDLSCLSSCIYDVVHFQETIENAIYLDTLFDAEEDMAAKQFGARVNEIVREKICAVPKKERRYDIYRDDTVKAFQFNTSLLDRRTDRLWLGMSVYRSNLPTFRHSVFRAEFGFTHVLKSGFRSRDSLQMAAVTDVLPEYLQKDKRVVPLVDAMRGWEKDFDANLYTLDDLVGIKDFGVLFRNVA